MNKSDNRSNYPELARLVDLCRECGMNVKVVYINDNGKEYGKKITIRG